MAILYPSVQKERKDFLQKGHVMANLRLLFQALHGLLVQPFGMHARASELVAQAFEVFRKRCAAASAALVGGGICHAGDPHKKARSMAGKGNSVEAL